MEGIVKGWAVALVVTVVGLLVASVFIPFQTPILDNDGKNDESDLVAFTNFGPQFHEILFIANEKVVKVAPENDLYPDGLWHNAMTFNGTIPGPLIVANQGDTLRITLRNEGNIVHSLNFHAGFGPSQVLSGVVNPGETQTWTMKVNYPGAFLYHCDGDNLNGIWEHITDGMYGGIVVRAPGDKPAREFYVAFNELYDTNTISPFATNVSNLDRSEQADNDIGSFDMEKFVAQEPDLVLTNGMAFRYIPWIGTQAKIMLNSDAEAFHVKAGELTRWYLFNAGPREGIAFNFGAGMVKEIAYGDMLIQNSTTGPISPSFDIWNTKGYDEVVNIPPGSGTIIEVTFPEPGVYFGNDHDAGSILEGAGFVVMVE